MLYIHDNNDHFILLKEIKKAVISNPETIIFRQIAFQFFDIRAKVRIFSELGIDSIFYLRIQRRINFLFAFFKFFRFRYAELKQECILLVQAP